MKRAREVLRRLRKNQKGFTLQLCASPGAATTHMDQFPSTADPLYPKYLRLATTQQPYSCDANGTIQHP